MKKRLNESNSLSQKTTYDIHYQHFFGICELSKNAIAVLETTDNGNTFIIKYINNSAEKIEGISRKNILKKSIAQCFPSIIKSGLFDTLKRVYINGTEEGFVSKSFLGHTITNWNQNFIYKLTPPYWL
ncbi:MAG: hypothetical protein MZV63_04260 [Marinilabiliales bacterium]|nr:hypothetical protein [Marinilabiliales bacterium]